MSFRNISISFTRGAIKYWAKKTNKITKILSWPPWNSRTSSNHSLTQDSLKTIWEWLEPRDHTIKIISWTNQPKISRGEYWIIRLKVRVWWVWAVGTIPRALNWYRCSCNQDWPLKKRPSCRSNCFWHRRLLLFRPISGSFWRMRSEGTKKEVRAARKNKNQNQIQGKSTSM